MVEKEKKERTCKRRMRVTKRNNQRRRARAVNRTNWRFGRSGGTREKLLRFCCVSVLGGEEGERREYTV
ncbi:hypothetical protein COLO4_13305 [Corchorus olitorius]|uniref:Uncharacterized protein n=1 Tax=Corchorus olitorius TaxID=93759 RepID=A0A1R3JX85_9ROSI|nr:hypothetical protein COLO4_13305 [Corchorus olitorius]